MSTQEDLFLPVVELPDEVRDERYRRLVGVDDIKTRLRREASVLVNPQSLTDWARRHHRDVNADALTATLSDRAPLIIFGGDVGSGKSALAESFGCDLARTHRLSAQLFRLKLTARGTGLVGEMTTLVSDAFAMIRREAEQSRRGDKITAIQILVIDEADALAQSREAQQMHHEDRAGVDAFLAGIDDLAGSGLPVVVVMCTNRLDSLDPAVRRRAAATFEFSRPNDGQRRIVLADALTGFGLRGKTLDELVRLTGEHGDRPGYTYSDLTQRLVPTAVLAAYPDRPLTDQVILDTARELAPSPVFTDHSGPARNA
ncbi:AAA family ATPase [Jatrophihabitans sp. YIM 134969]